MPRNKNKTSDETLRYFLGERKETLQDIILQIWNDGAEGIFYDKEDFIDFSKRIKKAIKNWQYRRRIAKEARKDEDAENG